MISINDLFNVSSSEEIIEPGQYFSRVLQFSIINTWNLVLEEVECGELINVVLGCQTLVLTH